MTDAKALGERMLRLARDDRPLAYLELQQDVVYSHLSPVDRTHYIDRSLAIGREQAESGLLMTRTLPDGDCRKLKSAQRAAAESPHGLDAQNRIFEHFPYKAGAENLTLDNDLWKLAIALGAKVEIIDSPNTCAGIAVRSEYDAATRTITLHERSIEEFGAILDALGCEPWPRERIAAVHLAHELFHHLEATSIAPVHLQLPAVVTGRIGPFPRETRARRCREIAAHAFARELLHLPFAPNAVDWLVLLARRPEHGDSLARCLDEAERAMGGIHDPDPDYS